MRAYYLFKITTLLLFSLRKRSVWKLVNIVSIFRGVFRRAVYVTKYVSEITEDAILKMM